MPLRTKVVIKIRGNDARHRFTDDGYVGVIVKSKLTEIDVVEVFGIDPVGFGDKIACRLLLFGVVPIECAARVKGERKALVLGQVL